jgi:hypothetical protein
MGLKTHAHIKYIFISLTSYRDDIIIKRETFRRPTKISNITIPSATVQIATRTRRTINFLITKKLGDRYCL